MNPIFGEPWDAPICEDAPRAETPVGVKCLWCQVPIEDGDRGILMAYMGAPDKEPTRAPYHRECLMLSTVGSPDHLDAKLKEVAEAVDDRRRQRAADLADIAMRQRYPKEWDALKDQFYKELVEKEYRG